MLDTIVEYLEILLLFLAFLSTLIGLIASLTKNKKLALFAEKLALYEDTAERYVSMAEEMQELRTGEQKLLFALSKMEQEFKNHGFDFSAEQAKTVIEKLIEVTRRVNTKIGD